MKSSICSPRTIRKFFLVGAVLLSTCTLQSTIVFATCVLQKTNPSQTRFSIKLQNATLEEIVNASKTVCADEFISKMPDGYQTEVRERGSMLSQGQKQLISFARTLLSDPAILILDEATSSIDVQTEKALQTGLNAMLKGRTSFIIAHRLSTIRNCDKIMYIDNGGIMESGTHDELMAKKGYYYKLYTAQLDEVQKAG